MLCGMSVGACLFLQRLLVTGAPKGALVTDRFCGALLCFAVPCVCVCVLWCVRVCVGWVCGDAEIILSANG